jgi:hypothetical protein
MRRKPLVQLNLAALDNCRERRKNSAARKCGEDRIVAWGRAHSRVFSAPLCGPSRHQTISNTIRQQDQALPDPGRDRAAVQPVSTGLAGGRAALMRRAPKRSWWWPSPVPKRPSEIGSESMASIYADIKRLW